MDERRKNLKPIPDNPELFLSEPQLQTVHSLEESGWHLWFVRRNIYLQAMPVLVEDESGQTAVIDKAGLMDTDHGLHFRDPEPIPRILH
jgi:hypothetical protein